MRRSLVRAILLLSLVLAAGPAGAQGPAAQISPKVSPDLAALHQAWWMPMTIPPAGPESITQQLPDLAGDLVTIDAASDDPGALLADLRALGLVNGAWYGRVVSGLLPIDAIPALENLASLQFVRPASVTTSAGRVTSQGDQAQRSDLVRAMGFDGSGVTVGVLSDSYNCFLGGTTTAAMDLVNGDLSPVTVVQEGFPCPGLTDEGRAMLQIVHDVAPGARLAFATALGGQANFANNIGRLRTVAGAHVIVDDVLYLTEPMFQDGVVAQAADAVVTAGTAYFSAAGNNARQAYDSPFRNGGSFPAGSFVGPGGTFLGGTAHDFDPGPGVDVFQSITFPGSGTYQMVLQWDSPFFSVSGAPGTRNDLNVYFLNPNTNQILGALNTDNTAGGAGGDAVELVGVNIPQAPLVVNLMIVNRTGALPGRLKYVFFRAVNVNEFATNSGTLYGHANAVGAEAVGAAFYAQTPAFGVTPPLLEAFSAGGPQPILFTTAGAPTFEAREHKPEITAPDGANTTFFGSDRDGDAFPNFSGTSAAAPHAAAVAALLLQAQPGLPPADVYSVLENTALDMRSPGFDNDSGFGLIQADAALAALPGARVTLSLTGNPMAEAGGTATVTATLSVITSDPVTVNLAFSGTADFPADYTRSGTSIVIPAGSRTASITLTAVQDPIDEPDETIVVEIDSVINAEEASTQQVSATIRDDDPLPTVTLGLSGSPIAEAGGTATVTATLSRPSSQAVTVNLGFLGTATFPADYTRSDTVVVIPAGSLTGTITLTAVQDPADEPNETIVVQIDSVINATESGAQQVTATIADDDPTPSTIKFSVATLQVAEGATATLLLTRVGSLVSPASADYQVTGGTATGGGVDFTLAQGTVSFAAGIGSAKISLPTVNDTLAEGNETVIVALGNPSLGATIGTPGSITVTITDNDTVGTIQFGALTYSVAENVPGGLFNLVVTRTGSNLASGVMVDYAVTGGSATPGDDFVLASGTITWNAAQTVAMIPVTIVNDPLPEGNETVEVSLGNESVATTLGRVTNALGTVRKTTLTILDNEEAIAFSAPTYRVLEGVASIAIPIGRTGPTPAGTTVTCRTVAGGTASENADYRPVNTTLTFAAGSRQVMCVVPILNDTVVEPPETVNLALSIPQPPPPGSTAQLGTLNTAVLTIDDTDQGGVIRFGALAYTVAEGAGAVLSLVRTGTNLAGNVTVNYAVTGGSATNGTDFTLAAGTIPWNAAQTTATIPVPTIHDTLAEGNETVVVTLSGPTGGASVGVPASTTLTITDNDTVGTIQFGAAAYSVAENVPLGTFNLVVTRTGSNLASGVMIDYAVTGGSATPGDDFVLASGTITWNAAQTSAMIPVTIVNDLLPEGNETVEVSLSNEVVSTTLGRVTNALGTVRKTTLTILDDEQAITFSSPTYRVAEGVASLAIPILRSGPTPAGTTVRCQTSDGTATAGQDYRAVDTILTFAASSRQVMCVVPILNDTLVEAPETVNLALVIPPGSLGMLGLTNNTAVLTIDDTDQGGVIRFGAPTYTVAEGAGAVLSLVRTGTNLAGSVTVNYAVTGGSATNGTDFTLAAGTIPWNAAQTTATIPVPTIHDTLAEGNETVVVTLSGPTGGASVGVPAATTLTITDNDTVGTIQFGAAAYSVAENVPLGTFNLVVTRTGSNLASGVMIDYAVTGGSATPGDDFVLASGTITWNAAQTSAMIPVTIVNDLLPEGNETVEVSLSNEVVSTTLGRVTNALGTVRKTTLTILDDEQALSFSAATYAVTEGTPSIAIPILRSGPTLAGTTVTCQTVGGGTAIENVDYRPVNTTLTYAAGSRQVMCTVPILNDTLLDGSRIVNLALSIPAGSAGLLGPLNTAMLSVHDNEQAGTMRFGAVTYTVTEGASGSLTVLRAGTNLAAGVTVNYAVTGGSATNGPDFTLAAGTITWGAGQPSATIPVPTAPDQLLEGDETVVVTLSDASPGAAIVAPASTTLTIRDATKPAQVRFGNDLVFCTTAGCRAFTARLRAEEGYTWTASSGTFSAYQAVRHPTLSNFVGEAVGIPGAPPLIFPGVFTIMPNRRYALVVTFDGSQVLLVQVDEGAAGAAAPLAAEAARLQAITPPPATGASRFERAPHPGGL